MTIHRQPAICVVIPAYNAAQTISYALASALLQHGIDLQIVVVDHGSSDGTPQILARVAKGNPIIILHAARLRGACPSASSPLNVGFEFALHQLGAMPDWIIRLDADDILASDTCLLNALEGVNGKADALQLISGKLVFFDTVSGLAQHFGLREQARQSEVLLSGGAYSLPHHSLLMSPGLLQRAYQKRGYYYDHRISYGEDLDFTLTLISVLAPPEICFVNVDLTFKRLEGTTLTTSLRRLDIGLDHLRIFAKHRCLRRSLLVRSLVDLALQQIGIQQGWLRDALGFPGKVFGTIEPTSFESVAQRLRYLQEHHRLTMTGEA
jgi:glycosyltransferase involved in cell wall biosynthesis